MRGDGWVTEGRFVKLCGTLPLLQGRLDLFLFLNKQDLKTTAHRNDF